MKLIVQIPCLNEEATLPDTLKAVPRSIPGIDVVEVLVVDDGSTDRTSEVARANGAVGDREVSEVAHFSWTKRRLQGVGSWVVRKVSGTAVADATSGFRALTREAALRINIVSEFTYTLESIIQAGKKRMAVAHLPITARETRPSRLMSSTWDYVKRSAATILRIYAMYEPFKVFVLLGSVLLAGGLALGARYAWFWAQGEVARAAHLQSAILSVLLLILGFQTLQWGVMADLIANNRKLIEDLLYRVRKMELGDRGRG